MRSQNGVGRSYNDRDRQVMLPFCLEHEILFQMRPDRRAGKRQVLPFQQWKLLLKPNFQLSVLVCFRLRERGRQGHRITHGPLRKTKEEPEARISSNAPWNHLQSVLFCCLFE